MFHLLTPSRRTLRVKSIASALSACFVAMLLLVMCASAFAAPEPAPPQNPPAQGDAAVNPPPAPQGENPDPEVQTERMPFLDLLMKGRWFMVPIGACSVLGLAIIFERLFALRKRVIAPPQFMAGLSARLGPGAANREAGIQYCHENDCPIGRIMAVGLRKMPIGEEAVEQAIEDSGANEISKLRKNLRMLYGVSAVAPMLGLLGTVWGMIAAFQVASQQGLGRAELLAEGIYEALVTTFAGLLVAIPVLIFYYYFLSRIDALVNHMNDLSERFVADHMPAAWRSAPQNPASTPTSAQQSPAATQAAPVAPAATSSTMPQPTATPGV